MKQLLILLIATSFFACSPKKAASSIADDIVRTDTIALDDRLLPEYQSTPRSIENRVRYEQTELSMQFDLAVDFTRYRDTTTDDYYTDSCVLKVLIIDKKSGACLDSLLLTSDFYFDFVFTDKKNTTSYSTGYNLEAEFTDNYFGDMVVVDLNFDGKDDIAVINDSGGNAGACYHFFMQTESKIFILDQYLSDTMMFFPTTIDRSKQQLTTFAHASAVSVSERIYQYDKATKQWTRVSSRIIGM